MRHSGLEKIPEPVRVCLRVAHYKLNSFRALTSFGVSIALIAFYAIAVLFRCEGVRPQNRRKRPNALDPRSPLRFVEFEVISDHNKTSQNPNAKAKPNTLVLNKSLKGFHRGIIACTTHERGRPSSPSQLNRISAGVTAPEALCMRQTCIRQAARPIRRLHRLPAGRARGLAAAGRPGHPALHAGLEAIPALAAGQLQRLPVEPPRPAVDGSLGRSALSALASRCFSCATTTPPAPAQNDPGCTAPRSAAR